MTYTFLLPAFKATYFREALESIKNQTYRDFKVIVSDDCSPEGTALRQIYDEVADPRFTFRRNAENMGSNSLVSHWNILVDLCDTDYLIMASDDDVYEPTFLEEINRLVEKYPACDLFRGRLKSIDEEGNLLLNDCQTPEFMDQAHFFYKYYARDMLTCEANYVYKTSVLKQKGGYVDFPKAWFTDDATHIMMAENGCAISEGIVFGFRQSMISISNRWKDADDARQKVEASLAYNRWITDKAKNIVSPSEKAMTRLALSYCKERIIRNAQNNIQNCSRKDFFRLSDRCQKEMGLSKPVLLYNWWRSHKMFF